MVVAPEEPTQLRRRHRPCQQETLHLVLVALGDALLGAPMANALGLPRETARELATNALLAAHLHPPPKG